MNEFEKISVERKKISQYIVGNARTLMIAFILFTVIVVMTTDIKLVTISSITDLGLEFFLLLFASYAMKIGFLLTSRKMFQGKNIEPIPWKVP